jgi:hypothetical protein
MMRPSTHLLLDEKHEGRQGGADDLIGCGNAFHTRSDARAIRHSSRIAMLRNRFAGRRDLLFVRILQELRTISVPGF